MWNRASFDSTPPLLGRSPECKVRGVALRRLKIVFWVEDKSITSRIVLQQGPICWVGGSRRTARESLKPEGLRYCRVQDYLPKTIPIPERSKSSFGCGSLPTRAVRRFLSRLTIWDTLATESFGSPVRRAERGTFPGAKLHLRLLVKGTHTTVAMRLRFNASDWTTTTGLRNPGPEPVGAGKSAHQISPCEITTRFALEYGAQRRKRTGLPWRQSRRRPCSWSRLPHPECGAPNTLLTRR